MRDATPLKDNPPNIKNVLNNKPVKVKNTDNELSQFMQYMNNQHNTENNILSSPSYQSNNPPGNIVRRLTLPENNLLNPNGINDNQIEKLKNDLNTISNPKSSKKNSSSTIQNIVKNNLNMQASPPKKIISLKDSETPDKDLNLNQNLSPKHKIIKNFFYRSQPGKNDDGLSKINQDNYLIMNKIFNLEDYNIFGILDGHGNNGHHASLAIVNFLKEYFQRYDNYLCSKNKVTRSPVKNQSPSNLKEEMIYERLKDNNYEVIRNAFIKAEYELTLAKFDVNFSGSTTVLVFIINDKIICANVGDSRAILINEKKKNHKGNININIILDKKDNSPFNSSSNVYYDVQALSIDHKPELESEKNRVINNGGRIEKYSGI